MYGDGALKGPFVDGVHRAARAMVRERISLGFTLAELARVAQTKGDEHRWLRREMRGERTKEREALAAETCLRRKARLAASPRVSAGARAYQSRDAPVKVVGPVDATVRVVGAVNYPTPDGGGNSRRRPRQEDGPSRPKARTGEHPCWQCGSVGHRAEVCPTLDLRLRERFSRTGRMSPLRTTPVPRGAPRMARWVAIATTKDRSSSSGDASAPLEKGEPPAGP